MKEPPPVPSLPPPLPTLTPAERRELFRAKVLLENPSLTARLANVLGGPIERGLKMLPVDWSATVHKATRAALLAALTTAVSTLGPARRRTSADKFHKLLVGASGGIGGLFGLASLPVELPVSTTIMLRSIADIARSEGHDIRALHVRLSCLEVFALGGRTTADDAAESSYWAVRAALAKALSEAAAYLAEKGVIEKSAPAVVRLIGTIASRFGVRGFRASHGQTGTGGGRRQWRGHQCTFYEALPSNGARTFHRAPFGSEIRRGEWCARNINVWPCRMCRE